MLDTVVIDIHCWTGENRLWKPHLIAAAIVANKDKNIVLEINDEGYDVTHNGLDELVKEVCDCYNIPYSQISYKSGDTAQKTRYFKHEYIGYNGDASRLQPHNEWHAPSVNDYGMFLVRPTNERLYAFYKHLTWEHFNRGHATFHFADTMIDLRNAEFLDFLINHNEQWQLVSSKMPYSDYEASKPMEDYISGDSNNSLFWNKVYDQCSIEIVCETNIQPNSRFITEKTLRPLMYGRLFMVVGSPGYEQYLKSLGFDIFEDLIDKTYDLSYSYNRVNSVFEELERLLKKNIDLVKLKDRLLANQARVNEFILEQQRLKSR